MFTIKEILDVIENAKIKETKVRTVKNISIDSRTVRPGELFIPIKGIKFDGRKFIPQVLKKGALVLDVEDGLRALQQLAAYHRRKFSLPIIGITGSVGKTTTKEMIFSILSQKMPTLKNELNYNNEIGVPLTLLKLTGRHKAAVIEMAMQGPGEIELLADIVRQTIALVTNIGESHLEHLKTKKNIAKAKAEIFKFLQKEDFAVINQDDEYFEHLKSKIKGQRLKIRTFGILEKSDVTTKDLIGITLPVPGEHNIYNALAAIAVAQLLKIDKAAVKKGLETFKPASKRMEVINCGNKVKIINDTYNANPQSMSAALKVLAAIEGRKIAVLGDMLELGKRAKAAHLKIVRLANKLKIDKLFVFGKLWPRSCRRYNHKNVLIKLLKKIVRPRDIILVKGSRGMKMEEVSRCLGGGTGRHTSPDEEKHY